MSTTAPENSVQTIGRYAWTGVKVAYGAAVVNHIFSRSEREPMDPEWFAGIQSEAAFADTFADARILCAGYLEEQLTAALAIQPGEPGYWESAEYVCEQFKLEVERTPERYPIDPAKLAKLNKFHGWAVEMLPVWNKIRVERKHQAKILQDEYLIKIGVKSKLSIVLEEGDFQIDRAVKYLLRSCIFFTIFMAIWLAIDPSSAKAFDNSLPKYNSGSWILDFSRWIGMKVD